MRYSQIKKMTGALYTRKGTGLLSVLAIAVLAGVFIWSGMVKILDPEAFALSVYRYHLLPFWAVNAVALWIPMLELVCGATLLFVPRLRPATLLVLLGLLIIFSGGIGINLIRGNEVSCGCFSMSPLAQSMSWLGLLKNVVLVFLVLHALRCRRD